MAADFRDVDSLEIRVEVLKQFPLLDITASVLQLASALIEAGVIPEKAARDAAHIAVSAVHGIGYLMTWNCAHIANAMIVKTVQAICVQNGFSCPVICTPEELMES